MSQLRSKCPRLTPVAEPTESHSVLFAPDRTKQARILIVDDEPINVEIVRKYLQNVGYSNLFGGTEATETFAMIARIRPELVLLDVMMPGTSGLEILEQMRSSGLETYSGDCPDWCL